MNTIKMLIIDEADEMLSLGFIEQINEIISKLDPATQVCFFSATLPESIITMTDSALSDPVRILVKNENITLEGISQYFMKCVDDDEKSKAIITLLQNSSLSQCFVYFNSKDKCERVGQVLKT
jgi:translation initiation factor 4A